ncbi:MAG: c-type cytochrome [Dichotomicrobium sp.]
MGYRAILGAAVTALVASSTMAMAQDAGDPEAGENFFRRCQACHMVGEDVQSRVGPPLNDLFGRQAGTWEGFNYSSAMTEAGENGLVWNDESVSAYLEDPKGYIPGNKMAFPGVRKAEDRQNVIAYLKTFDDEPDNDDAENTYSP